MKVSYNEYKVPTDKEIIQAALRFKAGFLLNRAALVARRANSDPFEIEHWIHEAQNLLEIANKQT